MVTTRTPLGSLVAVLLTLSCLPLSVEPPATPPPPESGPAAPVAPPAELGPVPPSPAPELSAATVPSAAEQAAAPTPEPLALAPLPPLTAEAAMDQVVERAPLPPEARFLARTLRPTMVAESDGAGHWIVSAAIMGQWRIDEQTWQVEPHDGTAQLWELQSRLDLR
jgi:hypothetical protein